jgi:hypothetical protein
VHYTESNTHFTSTLCCFRCGALFPVQCVVSSAVFLVYSGMLLAVSGALFLVHCFRCAVSSLLSPVCCFQCAVSGALFPVHCFWCTVSGALFLVRCFLFTVSSAPFLVLVYPSVLFLRCRNCEVLLMCPAQAFTICDKCDRILKSAITGTGRGSKFLL